MAVRREVVSLSQLLQRRKTSDASGEQHARLPLSQPTPPGASRYGPVRQRMNQLPARGSHHIPPSVGGGHQRQQSQSLGAFDAESVAFNGSGFSQSQDAFEDGGAFASLSQCSYSQSQNMMQSSQEEATSSRALLPPPPVLARKASLQEVSQPPTATSSDLRQIDKDVIENAIGPIQLELALMSAALREQAAVNALQLEFLKPVAADASSLRESVKILREKSDEVAECCNTCHEKILSETSSISSVVSSLEAKFSDVENQLKGITSHVDELVQSSKRVPVTSPESRRGEPTRWTRKDVPAESPAKARRSFIECGSQPHPLSQQDDFTHAATAHEDWDTAQQNRSLRRSLHLIEEMRAKRRRTKFFRK